MKKIVTIVLLVFLALSFGSIKSFAFFSNPWKNYNPKCKKFDFYCKRMLNKNPALAKKLLPKIKTDIGCKKHDYYCKRISKNKWLEHISQSKSLLGSL